jgi:hypothetical protein
LAVLLRRRRFAGAFFAADFRRRFAGAFLAVLLRRVVFRAVDLRAVVFLVVRRFAGLRAVLFLALLRAVRLFAGGTVTYLSLTDWFRSWITRTCFGLRRSPSS